MFHVLVPSPATCGMRLVSFRTEREARAFINSVADGTVTYFLFDTDGQEIVSSRFPVLMVA